MHKWIAHCDRGWTLIIDSNFYPSRAQPIQTTRCNHIGIAPRDDNSSDLGLNDCMGARWRFALMIAGFQRAIKSCPASAISRTLQGYNLCVRAAEVAMIAPADHFVLGRNNDATNQRIGFSAAVTARREARRYVQITKVFLRHVFIIA